MKSFALAIFIVAGVLVGFNQAEAITSPVYITTYWLPYGTIDSSYSAQINAYGGSDSYVWTVSSGDLPAGLSLGLSVCIQAPCQPPAFITGIPTTPGTYTFTIKVTSGPVTATRSYYIMIRPDTVPPIISNVNATNITANSATISWTTDELATSQVEFCTTYTRCGVNTPIDTSLSTQHSVNLSGLSPGTVYYYWVKSADIFGNLRISWARRFTTVSIPDTISPSVAIISPQNGETVTGTLTLLAQASDNVKVAGVMFFRDSNIAISYWEDVFSPYSVSFHTGRLSNGLHTFYAVARDASNNKTTSAVVTLNISNPDTISPYISNITVTNITSSSAVINWLTNEPADSQVEFCTTYMRCGNNTLVDPSLVTNHSVLLSGLIPNTYYYTWIKSKDASGNLRESYRTFRTLP